jgi:hypothetical protein
MSLYLINHLGKKAKATHEILENIINDYPTLTGAIDNNGLYIVFKGYSQKNLYLRSDKLIFDVREFFDECKRIDFELPTYIFNFN